MFFDNPFQSTALRDLRIFFKVDTAFVNAGYHSTWQIVNLHIKLTKLILLSRFQMNLLCGFLHGYYNIHSNEIAVALSYNTSSDKLDHYDA